MAGYFRRQEAYGASRRRGRRDAHRDAVAEAGTDADPSHQRAHGEVPPLESSSGRPRTLAQMPRRPECSPSTRKDQSAGTRDLACPRRASAGNAPTSLLRTVPLKASRRPRTGRCVNAPRFARKCASPSMTTIRANMTRWPPHWSAACPLSQAWYDKGGENVI